MPYCSEITNLNPDEAIAICDLETKELKVGGMAQSHPVSITATLANRTHV